MTTSDETEAAARGPGSMAEVVERVMRQRCAAQNAGGTTGVLIPFDEIDALLVAGAAASCLKDGVAIITAERIRQCASTGEGGEGWTAPHDDDHEAGELAQAAAAYAASAVDSTSWTVPPLPWPWGEETDKRPDRYLATIPERIRALAKAGALCAAEIDRLRRLEERQA